MRVEKLGHCCLLIDIDGTRFLTDPGTYSTAQMMVRDLTAVLITHEHPDHLHVNSLEEVLKNNPQADVYTNEAVGKLLDKANIPYTLFSEGEQDIGGVRILAFTGPHAPIYESVQPVENTGFLVSDRLFYPGDALMKIPHKVEILALPVAGPWLTIEEAIHYAIEMKPRVVFPVHDGMLQPGRLGPVHFLPGNVLRAHSIEFRPLLEGEMTEFT